MARETQLFQEMKHVSYIFTVLCRIVCHVVRPAQESSQQQAPLERQQPEQCAQLYEFRTNEPSGYTR